MPKDIPVKRKQRRPQTSTTTDQEHTLERGDRASNAANRGDLAQLADSESKAGILFFLLIVCLLFSLLLSLIIY